METLVIKNKKYVLLSLKEYNNLHKQAVLKAFGPEKLSLKEGKKLAYKLISK